MRRYARVTGIDKDGKSDEVYFYDNNDIVERWLRFPKYSGITLVDKAKTTIWDCPDGAIFTYDERMQ